MDTLVDLAAAKSAGDAASAKNDAPKKDTERAFEGLYDIFNVLDAKANALLAFNALLLTAFSINRIDLAPESRVPTWIELIAVA